MRIVPWLTPRRRAALMHAVALVLLPLGAGGDAIVRTQAMSASTIAEYYIEEGRVRLELEIGLADLESFRNLLPDPIYEKLGHAARPLDDRLQEFFDHDLVVRADGSAPSPVAWFRWDRASGCAATRSAASRCRRWTQTPRKP